VHYLDNKVFDITDARCNHEESTSLTMLNRTYCTKYKVTFIVLSP